MAVMSSADRIAAGADYQRDASIHQDPLVGLLKADVQAAIAAVDDWVVANAASFNAALPLPARTALTAAQKARLLLFVVRRRYEVGA
jgi:hypothetical protein